MGRKKISLGTTRGYRENKAMKVWARLLSGQAEAARESLTEMAASLRKARQEEHGEEIQGKITALSREVSRLMPVLMRLQVEAAVLGKERK